MIFQLSCLLLPLHRQSFQGCGLKRISTIVDCGTAVHGVIRVDFAGGFRAPRFFIVLRLAVFLKLLFGDELVYIIVLVDEERVCLLYVVLLAVV